MSDTIYLQGRLVAPTPAEAEAAIRARVRGMGYEAGEINYYPCPIQCWEGVIWWEYQVEVIEDVDAI